MAFFFHDADEQQDSDKCDDAQVNALSPGNSEILLATHRASTAADARRRQR